MSQQNPAAVDTIHDDMISNGSSGSHQHNYKTSLCHQWLTNGQCPRGTTCNYAHGTAEIRPRTGEGPTTLYKNNLCKFWQSGKCAHGDQCNYAHGLAELRNTNCPTTGPQLTMKDQLQQQFSTPNEQLFSSSISKQHPPPMFHPGMFLNFPPPPLGTPLPPFMPPPPFTTSNPGPGITPPPPFMMSKPPSNLLWGQPPQSAPTSLNSLLKRDHFQPLTGDIQHNPPPTANLPQQMSFLQQQTSSTAVGPMAQVEAQQQQSVSLFKPFDCSTLPPITMAQIAQNFEQINIIEPMTEQKQVDFNANDDLDFPSLESAIQQGKGNSLTGPQEEKKLPQQQPNSFANIAAKTPAGFAAAVMAKPKTTVKQSASASSMISNVQHPKQKCEQQKCELPTPVSKAITRPSKKILDEGPTIPIGDMHTNSVPSTPLLNPKMSTSMLSTVSSAFPFKVQTSLSSDSDQLANDDEQGMATTEAKDNFEALFEAAPYLNHIKNFQEAMIKSIEDNTLKEEEAQIPTDEWQTVIAARQRKSSLNAEHLSHRPSPCTDDGYQEGCSSSEENNHQNDFPRTTDSPASSVQQNGIAGSEGAINGETRLDKSHIFYRTHICVFWQANKDGKGPPCKHGERCFYAHGEKKLVKLNPIYFKTTLCEAYNNGQECPYGTACNFAHGDKDLRKPAYNGGKPQQKFFSVPHRHQLRKQRGIQTVHCNPTIAKPVEKVSIIKADTKLNKFKK